MYSSQVQSPSSQGQYLTQHTTGVSLADPQFLSLWNNLTNSERLEVILFNVSELHSVKNPLEVALGDASPLPTVLSWMRLSGLYGTRQKAEFLHTCLEVLGRPALKFTLQPGIMSVFLETLEIWAFQRGVAPSERFYKPQSLIAVEKRPVVSVESAIAAARLLAMIASFGKKEHEYLGSTTCQAHWIICLVIMGSDGVSEPEREMLLQPCRAILLSMVSTHHRFRRTLIASFVMLAATKDSPTACVTGLQLLRILLFASTMDVLARQHLEPELSSRRPGLSSSVDTASSRPHTSHSGLSSFDGPWQYSGRPFSVLPDALIIAEPSTPSPFLESFLYEVSLDYLLANRQNIQHEVEALLRLLTYRHEAFRLHFRDILLQSLLVMTNETAGAMKLKRTRSKRFRPPSRSDTASSATRLPGIKGALSFDRPERPPTFTFKPVPWGTLGFHSMLEDKVSVSLEQQRRVVEKLEAEVAELEHDDEYHDPSKAYGEKLAETYTASQLMSAFSASFGPKVVALDTQSACVQLLMETQILPEIGGLIMMTPTEARNVQTLLSIFHFQSFSAHNTSMRVRRSRFAADAIDNEDSDAATAAKYDYPDQTNHILSSFQLYKERRKALDGHPPLHEIENAGGTAVLLATALCAREEETLLQCLAAISCLTRLNFNALAVLHRVSPSLATAFHTHICFADSRPLFRGGEHRSRAALRGSPFEIATFKIPAGILQEFIAIMKSPERRSAFHQQVLEELVADRASEGITRKPVEVVEAVGPSPSLKDLQPSSPAEPFEPLSHIAKQYRQQRGPGVRLRFQSREGTVEDEEGPHSERGNPFETAELIAKVLSAHSGTTAEDEDITLKLRSKVKFNDDNYAGSLALDPSLAALLQGVERKPLSVQYRAMGPFLEGVKRPQGKGLEKLQQEYDYKEQLSSLLDRSITFAPGPPTLRSPSVSFNPFTPTNHFTFQQRRVWLQSRETKKRIAKMQERLSESESKHAAAAERKLVQAKQGREKHGVAFGSTRTRFHNMEGPLTTTNLYTVPGSARLRPRPTPKPPSRPSKSSHGRRPTARRLSAFRDSRALAISPIPPQPRNPPSPLRRSDSFRQGGDNHDKWGQFDAVVSYWMQSRSSDPNDV